MDKDILNILKTFSKSQNYIAFINTKLKENRIKDDLHYYEKHHILPKSLFE